MNFLRNPPAEATRSMRKRKTDARIQYEICDALEDYCQYDGNAAEGGRLLYESVSEAIYGENPGPGGSVRAEPTPTPMVFMRGVPRGSCVVMGRSMMANPLDFPTAPIPATVTSLEVD